MLGHLAATATVLALLIGCSTDDPSGQAAETSQVADTTTSAEPPTAGVESFCTEFADVVVQDDPDFSRLEVSAPEEVKPEVKEVVAFSEMAVTAEEAPEEGVIEDFQRAVAGMTIYAVDECDDIASAIESLGLDQADLNVLSTYSLEDVRDDATWPKVKKALGQP